MSNTTSIEWTDATWNPTRGCSRVSEGCRNCYAERVAARFSGPGQPYEGAVEMPFRKVLRCACGEACEIVDYPTGLRSCGTRTRWGKATPRWTGRVALAASQLDLPLRWRTPRRVFVDSMSDLFHEKLPDKDIAAVFGVMAACPQHTFQILTKRAERMRRWFEWVAPYRIVTEDAWRVLEAVGRSREEMIEHEPPWPLPNVWLGVSVEDQQRADERIPHLLETPAAVHFVSYEPALGPVDFATWLPRWREQADPGACACGHGHGFTRCPNTGGIAIGCSRCDCPGFCRRSGQAGVLDWVIVGGESGPGARSFDVEWARSVIALCRAAGTACFVKQLGARPFARGGPPAGPSIWSPPRDRKGGDPAEWPEDLRVRECPR